MLNTIILLTQTVQQQTPLANLLREHNPDLGFCSALSARDLAAISPETLHDARLVSFANDVAVSEKLLLQLGHGAYKFHIEPLQYPGLPPTPDQIDGDAPCFSAIAQAMTVWPDASKVVGLETVTIPSRAALAERERMVLSRLAHLFWRMSSQIACEAAELPGVIDFSERQRPTPAWMN